MCAFSRTLVSHHWQVLLSLEYLCALDLFHAIGIILFIYYIHLNILGHLLGALAPLQLWKNALIYGSTLGLLLRLSVVIWEMSGSRIFHLLPALSDLQMVVLLVFHQAESGVELGFACLSSQVTCLLWLTHHHS